MASISPSKELTAAEGASAISRLLHELSSSCGEAGKLAALGVLEDHAKAIGFVLVPASEVVKKQETKKNESKEKKKKREHDIDMEVVRASLSRWNSTMTTSQERNPNAKKAGGKAAASKSVAGEAAGGGGGVLDKLELVVHKGKSGSRGREIARGLTQEEARALVLRDASALGFCYNMDDDQSCWVKGVGTELIELDGWVFVSVADDEVARREAFVL